MCLLRQASLEANNTDQQQQLDGLYAKVSKPSLPCFPVAGLRKVIVLRHGERADFSGDWCSRCFDADGSYSRADLNYPDTIPERADAPGSYTKDCILTRIGELQARLMGEGFLNTKTPIHHVYCSPSLRCVMTASNVLKGINISKRMKIKVRFLTLVHLFCMLLEFSSCFTLLPNL